MRTALLVALLALAAVACRRDDDAPNATQTPGVTPSPAATLATTEATDAPTEAPTEAPTAAPQATLPNGPSVVTGVLTYGGRERDYRVYVPGSLTETPVPLVIGMHGGFGSGEQFANTTRFDEQAEAGRFIVVYPDGTGAVPTWNGGRCCGYAAREDVDDVGFIAALIDQMSADYPIDPARVFAVGHSNGAIMAFRLACELSDRIAAIGAVAGSLEISACEPDRPVSVLLIHGDADENHPFDGGQGPRSIANVDFMSVPYTMTIVSQAMGCDPTSLLSSAGPINTSGYPGCADGVTVELQVIHGASHAWPGGKHGPGLGGEPTEAMDATAVLWEFLSQHGR